MRARRAGVWMLFAFLVACGGGNGTTTTPSSTPPTSTRISSTAVLKVLAPQPGETVKGPKFVVKVEVTGARILTAASTDLRPDTGHVHLAVDGVTKTILAGNSYELTDLTPGPHLLQAEFAAADHGPFNPRVIQTVTFTVE